MEGIKTLQCITSLNMSCNEGLGFISFFTLVFWMNELSNRQIFITGVFFYSLGVRSRLIYTTCTFIYVRYGTGYNFPRWSPTLSGLMLVLSVPVLTRSPSRLQFLLAIATRLPFWLGPADLKRRVTLFGLDQVSEYH